MQSLEVEEQSGAPPRAAPPTTPARDASSGVAHVGGGSDESNREGLSDSISHAVEATAQSISDSAQTLSQTAHSTAQSFSTSFNQTMAQAQHQAGHTPPMTLRSLSPSQPLPQSHLMGLVGPHPYPRSTQCLSSFPHPKTVSGKPADVSPSRAQCQEVVPAAPRLTPPSHSLSLSLSRPCRYTTSITNTATLASPSPSPSPSPALGVVG